MDYLLIDAFTARPFAGNPAAVVMLREPLPDDLLQAIAMEFNQAETAYVRRLDDGRWSLRWFTPTREVPLCGHATLAAAHALIVALHARLLASVLAGDLDELERLGPAIERAGREGLV